MGFISVMKHIGHDLKVGFAKALPYAETAGEAAVSIFLPGASAMFNATVSAVALAENKYAALGQEKMGAKKLADILSLMEPVITQGLKDAGKEGSTAEVVNYINAVVTILNTTPVSGQ